jgi:polar amino acid transport system permease protein
MVGRSMELRSETPASGASSNAGVAPGRLARFVRSQSPLHWLLSLIVLVIAVELIGSVSTNENFEWGVVGDYLFSHSILMGLLRTLELTVIAEFVGYVLGALLAIMRLSGAPLAVGASWLYVWFFRGTPLLVQLIFWYNLGALYRSISLNIPFGPALFSADANSLITPFTAAILGLGLNSAAYMAEIFRSGIQSIHHGQSEAALALGMSRKQMLRHVIMPQAMRVIIPPASNELIGMLKYSALVSVLAYQDLLYSAQIIYNRTYQTIPLLIVVSIWYIVVTTVLTIGQSYVERHFSRGVRQSRQRRSVPREAGTSTDRPAAPASAAPIT